jgi:ABC-type polysaccharide/polyol phosphate export permease
MGSVLADVREIFREQVEFRELLWRIVHRDLLIRYKQSVMGFAWAIFMPLVNTVVFSVVFTRMAPIDVGMPYPLFAFSGLVVWNFVASALKFAITSLTTNTNLVTKLFFPREVLPISAVLVSAVDALVAASVLVAIMLWYGVKVHLAILFLPVVLLSLVMFTTGLALILSMLNLFYRDVKYLFEVLLTVWMFLTSVLYPVSLAGGRTAKVMQWNPMTPLIDAVRDVLIRGQIPGASFAYATAASVFFLLAGWLVFHRSEFLFAENA